MNIPDYIVIGAGSAGCALAARLSEDPSLKVTLIEAGGRDNHPNIKLPVGYSRTMGDPRFDWCFTMGPEPNLAGRTIPYTRGRVLGGCSSVNGLAYVRGQRLDFDAWEKLGCTGWNWDSVLPYFKRSEDFPDGGEERGRDGPLKVRFNNWHPLSARLVEASIEAGLPPTEDHNALEPLGLARAQLNLWRGRRFNAADAYLKPARSRPNLQVLTDHTVERITFENGKAAGVRIRRLGETAELRAGREIILCAGAIGSPMLLELSGIGRPERLQDLGIPVVAALSEVGEHLQDHLLVTTRRRLEGVSSFNEESRGLRLLWNAARYALFKTGFLSGTPTEVIGYANTDGKTPPGDVQLFGSPMSYTVGSDDSGAPVVRVDSKPGITLGFYQCRPSSRGHVHVTSPDGSRPPSLRANFLDTELDRDAVVRGLKLCRKILHQPAFEDIGREETAPGPAVSDDDALLDFVQQTGTTAYHAVGSCRMGSDDGSVVDPQLRIRGVSGLRVADASVIPQIIGANTHAATVMIGERAADLIRHHH